MSAGQETRLVNRIREAIAKQYPNSWTVKFHGNAYSTAGIPDILGHVEGKFFAIEVKYRAPGRSLSSSGHGVSPVQQAQIDRINLTGAVSGVAISVEEALSLVEAARSETLEDHLRNCPAAAHAPAERREEGSEDA